MHTVTDLTPVRVLALMETVINERGLCQGDFTDDDGRVCLEGAARFVIAGDPERHIGVMSQRQHDLMGRTEDAIVQAIGRVDPSWPEASGNFSTITNWNEASGNFSTITNWNDHPDRTVEDVQHVLAVARTLAGGAS